MYMVVGLGNPGFEYERTRHNAGYMFVDALATKLSAPAFTLQKKLDAEISKFVPYLLVKPTTFMNESGKAARSVIEYYKDLASQDYPKNIVAVYDDLDLEFGTYQIKLASAPKVHNGVNSLAAYLKTNEHWHVRIGVDGRNGDRSMPGSNYVLQKFSLDEQQQLQFLFESKLLPDFLARFPA